MINQKNRLLYQPVLFYAQKQRNNPRAPAKTSMEVLGTFENLQEAKELGSRAYTRNQHAYIGFGVMVKLGKADGEKPQL